ncbi:MAG: M1 family metallopeptidase [Candidatus Obscuribacterales bacterium]|nr:M1 family metallopeptidase [Candidatus Obscuribacterales bacterium]
MTAGKLDDYRLSKAVLPERYRIHLCPDLQTFTFTGECEIDVLLTEPEAEKITEIVMNAVELNISSASLLRDGRRIEPVKIELNQELERLTIKFAEALEPGNGTINIAFSGHINDKLRGFYRSEQVHPETGEKSFIALTQFEATDARRAFPCFDEPEFKATFQLKMTVEESLTVISNTAVAEEILKSNNQGQSLKTVRFKETMKMSTYIVAFLVGFFDKSETVDVEGIPFTVYAPQGKGHLTNFALDIGAFALQFFNSYYGIKYPGEKMDMIAVPDFAFGAMENLGAVIYRENALLVDPQRASHQELERVADVIAHELAHMWFGNLTTMKWWNGIWLNEAFATFMQLVAVENFKPSWKRWETFGVSRATAMTTDGLSATRKIEFPVIKPEEANGMFDVLTYEKGASVLRMLEQFIGEDEFKAGVNAYLQKHKYANTETADLWQALAESAKLPVGGIMDSWIYQEGYPLVKVEYGENPGTIKLQQERFFYLNENRSDTLFQIPLVIKVGLRTDSTKSASKDCGFERFQTIKYLLKEKEANLDLNELLRQSSKENSAIVAPSDLELLVINAGGSGFYRVHYDTELLKRIKRALQEQFAAPAQGHVKQTDIPLSTLERFNLINDSFALAVNGTVPLQEYLDFLKLFRLEGDKNVWALIISSLQYLERIYFPSTAAIRDLTLELLKPTISCLGLAEMPGESEQIKQLRGLALQAIGTTGDDKEIQKQLSELYDKNGDNLPPDILSAVLSVLAFCGDEKRYNDFNAKYLAAQSPQEKERYMQALAQFKQEALLKRTLSMTLTGEIRSQNAPYLVRNLMLNPWGRKVGWQFVTENWTEIRAKFPALIITRLVEGITGLIDEQLSVEAENFFADNPVKEGQKTVDQHREKLKVAMSLQKRLKTGSRIS